MVKQTKVLTRRRKFIEVEIPSTKTKFELLGESPEELKDRTIRLDLTRDLRGKSMEAVFRIFIEDKKPVAHPVKIKLMPYFIRRMIRKKISYVEDSFEAPSQNSMLLIKPFIITRKRVSRAVRKAIRNRAKNWLEDYISQKTDKEIFSEVITNKMQRPMSLHLKKTYPLSLCEIRILEIKRHLNPEEVPKKIKKKIKEIPVKIDGEPEIIDQLKEIEDEKIKKAEKEIKEAQEKASRREKVEEENQEDNQETEKEKSEDKPDSEESNEPSPAIDTKTRNKKEKEF